SREDYSVLPLLAGQLRKKNSPTSHLPKGVKAHRPQKAEPSLQRSRQAACDTGKQRLKLTDLILAHCITGSTPVLQSVEPPGMPPRSSAVHESGIPQGWIGDRCGRRLRLAYILQIKFFQPGLNVGVLPQNRRVHRPARTQLPRMPLGFPSMEAERV